MRRWISESAAQNFVSALAHTAVMMPDPTEFLPVTRDAKDDYLIALAQARDVDFIVSGDQDLLSWSPQIPSVVTPAQFEEALRAAYGR